MRISKLLPLVLASLLLIAGCGAQSGGIRNADENEGGYRQITQEEASRIMREESGYVILDVRTEEEFAEGHIPGAVCIPVETIGDEPPAQLPDKDRLILIYCRSGRRSKIASEQLAALGYTNILEFGGIITWTGETVTE